MRRTLAGIGTLIVALLLPAAAGAAVRKVELFGADSGNCTVSACRTIQYAANQGEAGDTVEIAQGFYIETVETTANLDFVGAGDGSGGGSATVILGLDGSGAEGHPAFILPNGGSLKSLAAKGGEGAGGLTGYAGAYAIEFKPNGLDRDELDLEAVSLAGGIGGAGTPFGAAGGGAILAVATEGEKKVTAVDSSLASGEGGGFTTKTAVEIYGDAMRGEFVNSELEANGGLIATGLDVREGATASIEKSAVEGFYGAGAEGGFLTVRHSHIQGAQWGLVVDPGSSAPGGEATVIDSVVESNSTAAFVSSGVGNRISKLTALGSDFISAPGPEPAIEAAASTPEQPVRVSLKNSIVHDVTEGAEQQKDLVADSATIEADHSSFTTSFASGGGTAPSRQWDERRRRPRLRRSRNVGARPLLSADRPRRPRDRRIGRDRLRRDATVARWQSRLHRDARHRGPRAERPELSSLSPASEGGDRDSDRLRIRDHEQEVRPEGQEAGEGEPGEAGDEVHLLALRARPGRDQDRAP